MPTKTKTAVVKKTAPKKAVKKVAVKKVVSSKKPVSGKAKVLVFADNQRSFWVKNGEILNNLVALGNVLEKMDKTVFTHHVTRDRNDFADWVGDVLGDEACAADLRKAKSSAGARTVVIKHLKLYQL